MKRVLIISPFFPPANSADMHRVRQSLPHFKAFGWEPVIMSVDEKHSNPYSVDPLLNFSIPKDLEIIKIRAFDLKITQKIGLGSLSLRSIYFYYKKGTELLKNGNFDLIYFSTTSFHVMSLGPIWKKRFKIPFVLDIQDPWRNDFYLDKPKHERPPKFVIAYTIDKWLEAFTIPKANGIISVSKGYIDTFIKRYRLPETFKYKIITFGASLVDNEIMEKNIKHSDMVRFDKGKINIVYIGRGGHDMMFAIDIFFKAFSIGISENPELYKKIKLWFIGTNYSAKENGLKHIYVLATKYGLEEFVEEINFRLPYFETLFLLKNSSILFVPGSTDTNYTASKIFPYILARKPLIAIFHTKSSVIKILKSLGYNHFIEFNDDTNKTYENLLVEKCYKTINSALTIPSSYTNFPIEIFEKNLSHYKTQEQCLFFNSIINDLPESSSGN